MHALGLSSIKRGLSIVPSKYILPLFSSFKGAKSYLEVLSSWEGIEDQRNWQISCLNERSRHLRTLWHDVCLKAVFWANVWGKPEWRTIEKIFWILRQMIPLFLSDSLTLWPIKQRNKGGRLPYWEQSTLWQKSLLKDHSKGFMIFFKYLRTIQSSNFKIGSIDKDDKEWGHDTTNSDDGLTAILNDKLHIIGQHCRLLFTNSEWGDVFYVYVSVRLDVDMP